ncbi:hypothetical protein ACZ90_10515 [Streptomyces albus subsp. albus]|nr:hypothetical protein ACZ90_10515 [Streptomyces albus subsp. albus]
MFVAVRPRPGAPPLTAGPSLISVDEASRLHLAEKIGARAVLVFEDSIEIPGSRIAVPGDGQAPSGTAEM